MHIYPDYYKSEPTAYSGGCVCVVGHAGISCQSIYYTLHIQTCNIHYDVLKECDLGLVDM